MVSAPNVLLLYYVLFNNIMQDDTIRVGGLGRRDHSESVVISSDSGEDFDDPVKVHFLCISD